MPTSSTAMRKFCERNLREDLAEEALVDGVRALGDLQHDAVGLEAERAHLVAEERAQELRVRGRRGREVHEDLALRVGQRGRLERRAGGRRARAAASSSVRSASEKSVSPLSNSLPRGPRERASMPIMFPVARSKTGWKTGRMSRPRDRVLQQLAAPDLGADRLARDLVARVLDAAVEQPLDAVLRVVHDPRRRRRRSGSAPRRPRARRGSRGSAGRAPPPSARARVGPSSMPPPSARRRG